MLIRSDDARVAMDFCYRDPVRFRHVLHDLERVCPEWDRAMADYGKSPEEIEEASRAPEPAPVFYVDALEGPAVLLVVVGGSIHLEGEASRVTAEALRYACEAALPKSLDTTSPPLRDCLVEAFGERNWHRARQYTTTVEALVPGAGDGVRRLGVEDRALWRRFVERHPDEGLVAVGAGGGGAGTRDYELMCAGLPVEYYAAIEDGEIAGFVSVNPLTKRCDEISALFVDPVFRRRGIAQRLVSVASQPILARGRQPGYFSGGGGDDIDRMLKGVGYYHVSDMWWDWSWD